MSQDGGNLVLGVRVTLDQQSGNENSGNEIKDGRHLGLNLNRGGMERVFFILRFSISRLCLHFRCSSSHVCLLALAFAFASWGPFLESPGYLPGPITIFLNAFSPITQ